jgi:transcriptional regulator with XRE-family HTH domain
LMGRKAREKPARLAEKLLSIRKAFGLSQNDLIRRLGLKDEVLQADISQYEAGVREPTLMELLKYARLAKVYIDVLVDDEIDLPEKLPAKRKSMGITRRKPWQPKILRRKK